MVKKPTTRRLAQLYAALLYNANLKGFVQGKLYTGNVKALCVPGLNCYSCPGAVAACPLGNVSYSPAKRIIHKCDMCDGEVWCAKYCPGGAIKVVDPDEVPDKKQLAADKLKAAVEEVSA